MVVVIFISLLLSSFINAKLELKQTKAANTFNAHTL